MIFDNTFYVYEMIDNSLSDLELLDLIKTTIQICRTDSKLYFACIELLSGDSFILISSPLE